MTVVKRFTRPYVFGITAVCICLRGRMYLPSRSFVFVYLTVTQVRRMGLEDETEDGELNQHGYAHDKDWSYQFMNTDEEH